MQQLMQQLKRKENVHIHGAAEGLADTTRKAMEWSWSAVVLLFLIGCEHMRGSAVETQMARRSREGCESFSAAEAHMIK